jgi:hypothetical protein
MARAHPAAWLVPAALILCAATAPPADGQGLFGQNKIQYQDFRWRVMKTPHIDLHFYPEEEEIAHWVAQIAEEALDEFLPQMNLELPKRIPFMLYSSPHAFQQTNVSPYLISESVGGLTDLIKGRVLLPHNGNYHLLVMYDGNHVGMVPLAGWADDLFIALLYLMVLCGIFVKFDVSSQSM